MINLNPEVIKDLQEYLEYHESDIAYGINDFDYLYGVFVAFVGRKPANGRYMPSMDDSLVRNDH